MPKTCDNRSSVSGGSDAGAVFFHRKNVVRDGRPRSAICCPLSSSHSAAMRKNVARPARAKRDGVGAVDAAGAGARMAMGVRQYQKGPDRKYSTKWYLRQGQTDASSA